MTRGASSTLVALSLTALLCACDPGPNAAPNWHVETKAQPTSTHPLAGFWKEEHCAKDYGLAIGPSGEETYYVSFCGPGGCFAEGTYRGDTALYADPSYRVLDKNTIEVSTLIGFAKYVRCNARNETQQ